MTFFLNSNPCNFYCSSLYFCTGWDFQYICDIIGSGEHSYLIQDIRDFRITQEKCYLSYL